MPLPQNWGPEGVSRYGDQTFSKKGHPGLRKWSTESIADEIRRMHKAGEDLNYATIAQNHVALLRAATRYFGSWKLAVEESGIGYENIRKYKTWTRSEERRVGKE